MWIAISALVAPFWQLPVLLKAILALVSDRVLAAVAVPVIMYFVNHQQLGEHRAGAGRKLMPGITAFVALALAVNGLVGFLR